MSKRLTKIDENLLKRLKVFKINRQRRFEYPKEELKQDKSRIVTHDKLSNILKLHISDPLTWNENILARIHKIPEYQSVNLIKYVKPMLHYTSIDVDTTKLLKTSFVFDVARFKRDKSYFSDYQRLVFPVSEIQNLSLDSTRSNGKT